MLPESALLIFDLNLFQFCLDQADKNSKAFYLYLRARALNVLPEVDPVAEESLSKALKLNPALIEAWNELGECLWKKGKVRDAKNCFENALKHVSISPVCQYFQFIINLDITFTYIIARHEGYGFLHS